MRIRVLLLASLLALPVSADSLSKYKDWGTSPQAYFLTKAEREQWSAIRDDASAEQFVNQYLAARGPAFADEITKRIAMAAADRTYSG